MSNTTSLLLEDQKSILLSVFVDDSEEGREWADQRTPGWDRSSEESVCYWEGVTCDDAMKSVIALDFSRTDLYLSQISSALIRLTTLEHLDLSHNLIRGTIPKDLFHKLPSLVTVQLQNNQLSGRLRDVRVPFVSSSLETVNLAFNQLTGNLEPDWWRRAFAASGPSKAFKGLDLQHNHLTGDLPVDGLEDLLALQTLSLSHNQFQGTVPDSLGNGDMLALEYLYLNHNRLLGTIPISWAATSVGRDADGAQTAVAPALAEVWLQHNDLSGTIPSTLAQLTKLYNLYLDGNKLTGTVPETMCSMGLNDDFTNEAAATISPSNDSVVTTNGTSDLACQTIVCPSGTVSPDGIYPCTMECNDLNPYLGRENVICPNYNETSIVSDLLSSIYPSPTESICSLDEVSCNGLGEVIMINATGRSLNGTIPDALGYLSHLRVLDLSDNAFTGPLPSGLRLAPVLESLDVSGNALTGQVPPLLCKKQNLNDNSGDDCDAMACPVGTYSPQHGRGTDCIICEKEGPMFLASRTCPSVIPPALVPQPKDDDGVVVTVGGDDDSAESKNITVIVMMAFVFIAAVVFFLFTERITKQYGNRKRGRTHQTRWSDEKEQKTDDDTTAMASSILPHVEELKAKLGWTRRGKDGKRRRRRQSSSGPTGWVRNRLKQAHSYVISLSETTDEPVVVIMDAPGAARRVNVTEGVIDDYGWRERESILKHRDIERAVDKLQSDKKSTAVWQYPDPLEEEASTIVPANSLTTSGARRGNVRDSDDGLVMGFQSSRNGFTIEESDLLMLDVATNTSTSQRHVDRSSHSSSPISYQSNEDFLDVPIK